MQLQGRELTAGLQGDDVRLLHAELGQLGVEIPPDEQEDGRYGPGTEEAVLHFQEEHGLDPSGVVNDATAAAINEAVDARRPFIVSGRVFDAGGRPVTGMPVQLYDIDLRGARVYQSVTSPAEIEENGGFERLGETQTDEAGRYAVTFQRPSFQRAERGLADVVAYALRPSQAEPPGPAEILAHSRLALQAEYVDGRQIEDLDIHLPAARHRPRTEYGSLLGAVQPLLDESDLPPYELSDSEAQIAFLAQEVAWPEAPVRTLVQADRLRQDHPAQDLNLELLYGLGRQEIALNAVALAGTPLTVLSRAIQRSIDTNLIAAYDAAEIEAFVEQLQDLTTRAALDRSGAAGRAPVRSYFNLALPDEPDIQEALLRDYQNYEGDRRAFWSDYPLFQERPEVLAGLQRGGQLAFLSGFHLPLVKALHERLDGQPVGRLVRLSRADWQALIDQTGLPEDVPGDSHEEKQGRYINSIMAIAEAAYPTAKVAHLVETFQIKLVDEALVDDVVAFFSTGTEFDLRTSRVIDHQAEIETAVGDQAEGVVRELKTLQRVFQVSPTPAAMASLMEAGLYSAYHITQFPRSSFLQQYGERLGPDQARQVYERASYIQARNTLLATTVQQYAQGVMPAAIQLGVTGNNPAVDAADQPLSGGAASSVDEVIKKYLPNYENLFGRLDLCECEHCRSVFSPAAYLVDLLQFLDKCKRNQASDPLTPLDILIKRRPDLAHLPLTCENTNTVIPYIDLVNEIMEYYVAYGKLDQAAAYDTGDTSTAELQAEPQHTLVDGAYGILASKDAVYPFGLPYHQPLDTIRIYLDHLNTSYPDLFKIFGDPHDPVAQKFMAATSLKLSPVEFHIISGQSLSGAADTRPVNEYYGYNTAAWKDELVKVPEFLRRTGLDYTDVVALLNTRLINPAQKSLPFLETIRRHTGYAPQPFFQALTQIWLGNKSLADYPDLEKGLETAGIISKDDFPAWLKAHFAAFRELITLYEPTSACDLDKTSLGTIADVYEGNAPISDAAFGLMHRLIRLWRKLDWALSDLDLMIHTLDAGDLGPDLIAHLAAIVELQGELKLSPDRLACLWGEIDTWAEKSLYERLFLSKALLEIDVVVQPDAQGEVLTGAQNIGTHLPVIQAALRLAADEIDQICADAALDLDHHQLTLARLSILYRYPLLARALKTSIRELIWLKQMAPFDPLSQWDADLEQFTAVSPADTLKFVRLVRAIGDTDFSIQRLAYLFLPPSPYTAALAPDQATMITTVGTIREALLRIELDHPAETEVDENLLREKLSLIFDEPVVTEILALLSETPVYTALLLPNLDITFPAGLTEKVSYHKASGRLEFRGIMTASEKTALLGVSVTDPDYPGAVEGLFQQPEQFIHDTLFGVYEGKLPQAVQLLLNRPAVANPPPQQERWQAFYGALHPFLKKRLRQSSLIQALAAALGLDDISLRSLLTAGKADLLADSVAMPGLSGVYYLKPDWTDPALSRVDPRLDFDWQEQAPDPLLPADEFSVRWAGWLVPPDNGPYTIVARVADQDDALEIRLDDELILKRQPNQALELEALPKKPLQAGQFHRISVAYSPHLQQAGLQLYWKTPAQPKTLIAPPYLFPESVWQEFIKAYRGYYRASLMVQGFSLTAAEIEHFIRYAADFDGLDLQSPTFAHWQRLQQYAALRQALPGGPASLIALFEGAHQSDPNLNQPQLVELLVAATRWNQEAIDYWLGQQGLNAGDFANEKALITLHTALKTAHELGLPLNQLLDWSKPTFDFDGLAEIAQAVKRAVKTKYDEETWLEIAPALNDRLRENQKQALIQHLLVQDSLQEWGVRDADGLFEYFLIDVQMDACMDTSRIKQASAAVQLFVQRCLLNLESRWNKDEKEIGVSPGAIALDRWEWMKHYRVWEANRKVFLYPENWLEPEWRDDKSFNFDEAVSELLQNDITRETALGAFRTYMKSLDPLAKLDLVGNYVDEAGQIVHVIGRTVSTPYQYYYRRQDLTYDYWTPWEIIDLDIKGEDDGETSGVHLMPIVWQGRLLLFWPIFTQKTETIQQTDQIKEFWEVQLAWSEYKDDSWAPKQVFPNSLQLNYRAASELVVKSQFIDGNRLQLTLHTDKDKPDHYRKLGKFTLSSLHDTLDVSNQSGGEHYDDDTFFLKRERTTFQVGFGEQTYLGIHVYSSTDYSESKQYNYQLLPSHRFENFEEHLSAPFFYQDQRSRFYVKGKAQKLFISPGFIPNHGATQLLFTVAQNQAGFSYMSGFQASNVNDASSGITAAGANTALSASASGAFLQFAESVPPAFVDPTQYMWPLWTPDLKFDTFYHPHVPDFVAELNRGGIEALFAQQFELAADDQGKPFKDDYQPTGLVETPYPRLNLDFRWEGAYAGYNWELFFHLPLSLAIQLSKNLKFAEAQAWFHVIFDPTTNETPDDPAKPMERFWRFVHFRNTSAEKTLETFLRSLKPGQTNTIIDEWRDSPFRPHLIARHFPVAYMKKVVLAYLDNLIAWGDHLFRQDTLESINGATQLYVMAAQVLGPRPQFVPRRGTVKAETYDSLVDKLDAFSNASVELENLFPYSSEVNTVTSSGAESLLGMATALYFCLPPNEQLLTYWDTVADRLFKIRHCMNIAGIERQLPLFEPPIDPALLVQATAQGLSIGSVLSDLNSPTPPYRFTFMLQKALELTQEVKAWGQALLAAIEKRDAEKLSVLKATQEVDLLEAISQVREAQISAAEKEIQALQKSWDITRARYLHYQDLLGIEPTEPKLDLGERSFDNDELPKIVDIPVDVDVTLVDTDVTGVKLIPKEWEELEQSKKAYHKYSEAGDWDKLANISYYVPELEVPVGPGTKISFGGKHIGPAIQAYAKIIQAEGDTATFRSGRAGKMAQYIRRDQEWTFMANQAGLELKQLAKQFTVAKIRKGIAVLESENHQTQIDQAQCYANELQKKFTNEELYNWMKAQTFRVYEQAYQLAYEIAKQAEKCYRFELGESNTNFIQFGYWDSAHEGLLAGDRLLLALKRMEKAYLDNRKRDYELTRHISLNQLNPLAILQLRETGACEFDIPELLFDMDHPGHYFRLIKSVSLTVPCVIGPYTGVTAKLTLLKNRLRQRAYAQMDYGYTGIEDSNFIHDRVDIQSIATSSGQNDSGLFELNFRDERYLPFEGAGAISSWRLELPANFRQFDYDTIADVILHLNYTAREGGDPFKEQVNQYVHTSINNWLDEVAASSEGLPRLFSLKHEFPNAFHRLLSPTGAEQSAKFEVTQQHFPYFLAGQNLQITEATVYLKPKGTAPVSTSGLALSINKASISDNEWIAPSEFPGTDLKQADVSLSGSPIKKWTIDAGTDGLDKDELEDILILFTYTTS
jgi:hypothetical protein